MNRFTMMAVVLGAVAMLTVACDEIGSNEACVTAIPCVSNEDCNAGQHCNKQLEPPMCQFLYCGGLGSVCFEDEMCSSMFCYYGICDEEPENPGDIYCGEDGCYCNGIPC